MTFKDLGIIEPILKALKAEGYSHPTPIQEQSIPILLNRKDLLVVTKHPFADEVEEMPTKKKSTRGQKNFNKPLKRTKDSDNKAIRSKDKRESKKIIPLITMKLGLLENQKTQTINLIVKDEIKNGKLFLLNGI